MENIEIFEKHFRKGMVVKDFEDFKRTHPQLLNCILEAMSEVLPQADVIKSVCVHEWDEGHQNVSKCKKCGKYSA